MELNVNDLLVTLSIRKMNGLSKEDRAHIKYYTNFIQCKFKHLMTLLSKDYMYSPWNYIGYEQNLMGICSEAQFVVIDVDSTSTMLYERLEELKAEDISCIIGTTSDTDNMFKYRIVIPIDRPITPYEYRLLVKGIEVNGLITDMDPVSSRPSQKFYSYLGSTVISNFDGQLLCVDDYIIDPQEPEYRLLDPNADVAEILPEFNSYSRAIKGGRTRSLIHAAFRCVDYGLTQPQLERVVNYVNSTFLIPKDTASVQRRVFDYIKQQRKFNDIRRNIAS